MLTIRESVDKIVRLTVDGKVEESDLKRAAATIEEKVAEYGKLRMYAEMHDLKGYSSFSAFLTDAKETLRPYNYFERMAIVADEQWLSNLSVLANLINSAETKQFSPTE